MVTFTLTFLFCVIRVIYSFAPEEYFLWNEVTYAWPNSSTRESFIQSGDYIPGNNLPFGLDRWRDKLFVTVPRNKAGVPSTLNYVPVNSRSRSPDLIPYPNLEVNSLRPGEVLPTENRIVSAFRVRVDTCDRLWVIDMALDMILGRIGNSYGPPSIIIYDLKSDQFIRRYPINKPVLREISLFPNIIVDISGRCNEAFAYIPDMIEFGLVVYSFAENKSWRVNHNYFLPDPLKGDFTMLGFDFQWRDGVCGLALSAPNIAGYRTMHFHPVCSTKQFSVSTQVLRNQTLAEDRDSYIFFEIEGDKGDRAQSITSDLDEFTNVLFLTQLDEYGVACWDTRRPLNPDSTALVLQDSEKLIMPNDLKVDNERNVWILSDKYPMLIYSDMDSNEVNYRIFKIPVDDLIRGTACEGDSRGYHYGSYI